MRKRRKRGKKRTPGKKRAAQSIAQTAAEPSAELPAPSPKQLAADEAERVWPNLLTALGAEVREHTVVQGVSGIEHKFQAIAVDDKTKRVLLISADPDPKIAALTQVDIQQTMPDSKVIIARPIALDLGGMARKLAKTMGTTNISFAPRAIERFGKLPQEEQEAQILKFFGSGSQVWGQFIQTLPLKEQVLAGIIQVQHLDWLAIFEAFKKGPEGAHLPLKGLMDFDNLENDRRFGVCPIPLYDFTHEDWELFTSKGNLDEIAARLKTLGIYQYYFPSKDELALGLVEKGRTNSNALTLSLAKTTELGHPFGDNALVTARDTVGDLIGALKEAGFLVSSELEFELTDQGYRLRAAVKSSPKESLVSKIIRRMRVNLRAEAKVEVTTKLFGSSEKDRG